LTDQIQIDAAFILAWSYFVNVMEDQTESGVVARMMSSRSLAKPSRSQILPELSQAQAKRHCLWSRDCPPLP
jgi:hypothetical protein